MAMKVVLLLALVAGAALAEPCADGQCAAQDGGDDVVSALSVVRKTAKASDGGLCCYGKDACSGCNEATHECSASKDKCEAGCHGHYDTGCPTPAPSPPSPGGTCCYGDSPCSSCNEATHECSASKDKCEGPTPAGCGGHYDTGCSAPAFLSSQGWCSVGEVVQCYLGGNVQTCKGDQCCHKHGSVGTETVTCPSASVYHLPSCTDPKPYDCTR